MMSRRLVVLLLNISGVCGNNYFSFLKSSTPKNIPEDIVVGVDGGTESIRACCFDAKTGAVIGKSCAVAYETFHPSPGWAEQNPDDWYKNLGSACRQALDSTMIKDIRSRVRAICVDTTCCSVVALDSDGVPLRPSLLWMDARSAKQTKEILEKCKGDKNLRINSAGKGPLSAEWLLPKSLWIRQNEEEIWESAKYICEYQDYINYKLTGNMVASSCNAAVRWHWDGVEALKEPDKKNPYPGRPMSLYKKLKIPELAEKLPQKCIPMGSKVGSLTLEAAEQLSLPEGLLVVQGGPDAFVGMIGLGCINPGQLCLITGSSHLHCCVVSQEKSSASSPHMWGVYRGAPLPNISFAEGGQSSTGSILKWAKNKLFNMPDSPYKVLDDEALLIEPGADGISALETFQGSRTPTTDPLARGALLGITLSHTRGHVWRSLLESICLGTRACIQGLENAGLDCTSIVIAGGATRSPLFLSLHSHVTGKPVIVCENSDAPLLGCAILASACAGFHNNDVGEAVRAMVREKERIEPDMEIFKKYTEIFDCVYSKVPKTIRPIVHALHSIRGGSIESKSDYQQKQSDDKAKSNEKENLVISPSILASDWTNIRNEIHRCLSAKTNQIHVDIFDGVCLSEKAFTFGPKMISDIRKYFDSSQVILDVHMCVYEPGRFVELMADAGADHFIFQYEACFSKEGEEQDADAEAKSLARKIVEHGMKCGVSINPETNVEDIYGLLETGLVSITNVLAVNPGFGGQRFQKIALEKVEKLCQWKKKHPHLEVKIMVDDGINEKTAMEVKAKCSGSGVDIILVAGTFLFEHPNLSQQVQMLKEEEKDSANDEFISQ